MTYTKKSLALLVLGAAHAHADPGFWDQREDRNISLDNPNGTDTARFQGYDIERGLWSDSHPKWLPAEWQADLAVRINVPRTELGDDHDYDWEAGYSASKISVSLRNSSSGDDNDNNIVEPDDSWAMCLTVGWTNVTLAPGQAVDGNCSGVLTSNCLSWLRDGGNRRGRNCRDGASSFLAELENSPCGRDDSMFPLNGSSIDVATWWTSTNVTQMQEGFTHIEGPWSDDEDAGPGDGVEGNTTYGADKALSRVWVVLLDWGQPNNRTNGTKHDIDPDSVHLDGVAMCLGANEQLQAEDDDNDDGDDDDDDAAAMLRDGRLGGIAVLIASLCAGLVSFVL